MERQSINLEANGKPVVVAVDDYKTHWYLSARFYYIDQEVREAKPGRNGINIRIDGDEGIQAAQAIIDAMQTALDTLTHQEVASDGSDNPT